jgi:nitrate reductase gamma subunit
MASRFLFVVLPYISVGVFLLGFLYRFYVWLKAPVPLRIVATPAPKTRTGVLLRILGDLLWFPNLFKAEKPLWVAGWTFHILLWLVLLRHLRYFLYPIPGWVEGMQTWGLYASYFLPLSLAFLLGRRLVTERSLYISILGDYFALFLLLGISVSGILLGVFFRTYIVDVKAFALGLVHFRPVLAQFHWLFALHFLLVLFLLIYFPFSKLMHAGGVLVSPTRNQRANFEERFVNPWDFPVAYNPENIFPPEKYKEMLKESSLGSKK